MIVYLDSSVILRVVLGEPQRLREWKSIETGVTSALAEVECLRTLDRLRLRGALSDPDLVSRREAIFRVLEALEIVELTRPVLSRASQPFPTSLGSLDAIHLATALLYRERGALDLRLATHDRQLAEASRASGFVVLGDLD